MGGTPSTLDTLGAVLLGLWAVVMWAAVAVLAYANRGTVRPWLFRASAGVIILGIVGQLGHVQEHFAQVGYWVAHPNERPWMTPWGTGLADGLGVVDMSKPSLGMEILHMTGNFIFLAGLVGVMLITKRALNTRARKWGRMGVWMQGIHGIEHVVLTLSVALGANQAIGMSTFFGFLDPGPGLWTYRIWWHFVANVVGTVIFAIAVYHLWRERHTVEATYRTRGTSTAPAGSAEPELVGSVPGKAND
ncbi:DUF6008 family protein [Amycolatopsis cihanbeyliensis]|uniref:Uncharacterized protein n=1 Tax=Amycolatopsis cihanbeyliensis TaxID=1128664 RepID=A0A542DD10_AMYCI|nr:DUF6008 family protein [Amycolatopsis cihanbeyliensis]TQJ00945.1 hypothetical protein FB471_0599 [Amycolatopsis cihanbeyliensis]